MPCKKIYSLFNGATEVHLRSDITSTQMQAFEQIKELSISRSYVRQLLIELNASRDLGLGFVGAQGIREEDTRIAILTRARRALVAVSDVTIYGLGMTLENVTFMNVMQMQNEAGTVDTMLKRMVSYLRYYIPHRSHRQKTKGLTVMQ